MAESTLPIDRLPVCGAGPLRLPAIVAAQLQRRASRGYPHEVCGLLLGRVHGTGVEIVDASEARNLETSRSHDRYVLDPLDWLAAEERARRGGLDVVGVWHTHPDHPARPSSTDLEAAWPDFSYLILAVRADGVTDVTAWRLAAHDGDTRARFVRQPVEEIAS